MLQKKLSSGTKVVTIWKKVVFTVASLHLYFFEPKTQAK